MTCEVVVMNRYALVMAADSAVTTRDRNGEPRYSKGGNKLFQLSHFDPVGIMIFGGAGLHGIPWEIIIKAYRSQLKRKSFRTLPEYASDFFTYVKAAQHFFPASQLDAEFDSNICSTALRLVKTASTSHPRILDHSIDVVTRQADWQDFINTQNAELDALPFSTCLPPDALVTAVASIPTANFFKEISNFVAQIQLANVIPSDELCALACKFFLKRFSTVLSDTGLVFSGYGQEQHFPHVVEYRVPGFVGRHLIYHNDNTKSSEITLDQPSDLLQFAMTSEVDAFTKGLSFQAFMQAEKAYETQTAELATKVLAAAGAVAPADLPTLLAESSNSFLQAWFEPIRQEHQSAIRDGVALLPLDELVHLAETLVVLQSLKERMTAPSQSVGGPIDIAVITKSEGLVWVKRKHFFDSEKNLSYVLRQKAIYD